jgi:hypothetical protein
LASSDSGDARLPGACGGDDKVRRSTANPTVVVAACLVCRWAARVRLKAAGATEIELEIQRPGGVLLCVFAGKERGGRGVFIEGLACARG